MSEFAVKPRQPVDLGEFERRLRGPDVPAQNREDPLAELARLVENGSDPFVAAPTDRGNARVTPLRKWPQEAPPAPQPQPNSSRSDPEWDTESEAWARLQQPLAPRAAAAPHFKQPVHEHYHDAPDASQYEQQHFEAPRAAPVYAEAPGDYGSTPNQALQHSGQYAHAETHPETHPDAYDDWRDQAGVAPPTDAVDPPRRSRMALYAVTGAAALVVLGVGATFALKSGPAGTHEAPVIKASTGPTKVQPETSAASASPTQSASILDKSGDKLPATRVTGNVEQPVDVAAQNGAARSVRPATQPAAGIFPEPRRVRTVSVRPDGSIVGADIPVSTTQPAAAAVPTPAPRPAQAAIATPVVSAVKPATPAKMTARVAARQPDPDAEDATPVAKPVSKPLVRPPAKTVVKPAAKSTEKATESQPASAGGFSVQLGLGASDADARAKAGRMQSQFGGDFGGRRATVIKGDVNGKTVYRVRVVGLSQEGATALCGKVKGGGGDCFVAR